MKKFWTLGAMVATALTLVACGPFNRSAKGGGHSNQPVTITYWHRMTGRYADALGRLIEGFNASQLDYKVVGVSQGSYSALQEKIMAAAKTKTLPTLAQAPYTNIGDYVESGLLVPFDAEMLHGKYKLTAAQLKDIYPSFLAAGKYQDQYYGMPFSVSTRVLYYNQKLMDENHLQLPRTWDDIAKMAPALKAKGLSVVGLDRSYDVELEGMAYQAGVKQITENGQVNLTVPSTLKAANLLLDLTRTGGVLMAGKDNYFTKAFLDQKVVFGIASSASIPELEDQAPKTMKWDTSAVPSFEGKNDIVLNGNDNVMFKGATKAQRRGAWLFQKYLLEAENTANWAMDTGYVPVTKSGVASSDYQSYLRDRPYYQATVQAIAHSFASTVFAGYTDYRSALMATVDATLGRGVPVDQAFGDLQAKTKAILDRQPDALHQTVND